MWIIMILAYTVAIIVDTKAFSRQENKGQLILYCILMVLSCAIGIASDYVKNMPSPADVFRRAIEALMGK